MLKRLSYLLSAFVIIGSLFVGVGSASASPTFTEYPIPTVGAYPVVMAVGSDNALWFTDVSANQIGRIDTLGNITEYPLSTPDADPFGITAGPDGALWFTEFRRNNIGRITTSGVITEYPFPTEGAYPESITAGSDGALWFTENRTNKIGRITTSGLVTEYPVPTADAYPFKITPGPDGALWFVEAGPLASKIGRITTSGDITEYALYPGSYPAGITAGPDGALWFTEFYGQHVGRITTSGVITQYSVPGHPFRITPASDGALWFTIGGGENKIGRITTSGSVTEYQIPTPNSGIYEIVAGPDNAVWFPEPDVSKIGRIDVTPPDITPPVVTGTPSPTPNSAGWNNTDVTVNWTATDPDSPATTPSPTPVNAEGVGQVITSGNSCDPAGNCARGSVTLNIDKTIPTLGLPAWSSNPKPTTGSTTLTVPTSDNLSGIQRGEYFIGASDPGQGNGTVMQAGSGNLTANFGTTFQPGVYKVNIRVQDIAGNWSAITSDYLVVYNPDGPTDVAASKKMQPTVAGGDVLPGLISDSQNDKATIGFDVFLTPSGTVDSHSKLSLDYATGQSCNSPHPNNCHNTTFTVTTVSPNSFQWLTITGANSSVGTFQGVGTLTIDGTTTANPFKVVATDGDRAAPAVNDEVLLEIYAPGANPDTASALYRLHVAANGNWVKVQ